MGKGIYTYYKERLIEIGGNNKCLCLKSLARKSAYDIGRIFEGRDEKVQEFVDFLWTEEKRSITVIGKSEKKEILENLDIKQKNAPAVINLVESEEEKQQSRREKSNKRRYRGRRYSGGI